MKVWKTAEYWMYFPFFKLHSWGKRSAVRRRRFIQRLRQGASSFPLCFAASRKGSGPFLVRIHTQYENMDQGRYGTRLLLEETPQGGLSCPFGAIHLQLSAQLTDEVFAAKGGVYRTTNSPQSPHRRCCLPHTSSVMKRLFGATS